jgi:hypothetical protein
LIHGYTIHASTEATGLERRAIETRRARIRDRLGLSEDPDDETLKRIAALGIDLQRGSLRDLSSLFCQPAVAQALKRIAWFYGELPAGF